MVLAMSAPPTSHVSLADLGFEALHLFQQLVDAQDSNVHEGPRQDEPYDSFPVASFAASFERFELWAVNLGLFITGHGSLDYRVRDAERLAQTIRRFMKELVDSLTDVIELRSSISNEQQPTDEENDKLGSDLEGSSGAEESDNGESDMEVLLDAVRDPIDRLYMVSTKIRNPASRLGPSRALSHTQIDEETGIDFLRVVETFDRDYIRSLFLQYQKDKALQEHTIVDPDSQDGEKNCSDGRDCVWEPIREVLSSQGQVSFLVQRLARANTRRRQQFAYWKAHRDKLLWHTHASISTQSLRNPRADSASQSQSQSQPILKGKVPNDSSALIPPPVPPSVTTATRLNVPQVEAAEQRSAYSVSEYAPSMWQPARDAVTFPPLPRDKTGDKFFECPYCMTFCPRSTLADKAWKAHVIRDLRPYICTYEDCKNPDQLYDSRQDWVRHENSCHRKVWRCLDHSDLTFTQLDAYQQHLQQEHNENSDGERLSRMVQASESILNVPDRPCPICSIILATSRAMQGHIALHLERFALFSLSRSIGDDDDDIDDVGSHQANGTIADSRDEDFDGDGDLDLKSEGAEDKDRALDAWVKSAGNGNPIISETEAELTQEAIEALSAKAPSEPEGATTEDEKSGISSLMRVTGTTIMEFQDHNTPVYGMGFSVDNKHLVSVSDDKVVRLWDLETGVSPEPFKGHAKGFRSVAWSPDGKIIASGSYDRTVKLWDAATGSCFHTLSGHGGAVSGLAFASDSKLLVSASHDKLAKLWNVETGALVSTLEGHTVGVFSVTMSPDNQHIITGSNDRTAKVWDAATGMLRYTLHGHKRVVYAVAVSPDSRVLATGSNDWTIKLWDLEFGILLCTLRGHRKGVTTLAFSPDGRLLVSGSYDHTIRFWDMAMREVVGILEGHGADIYAVAFSRDGTKLASGSRDRTLRLWDLHVREGIPTTTG